MSSEENKNISRQNQLGQEDGITNGRSMAEAGSVRVSGSSMALPAIEKLKGRKNYSTWAFAMRMILIREGSWSAVRPAENALKRVLATIF